MSFLGPGSSVGIATGRSADQVPEWVRFSAPVQTDPEAHPASCKMGTPSSPGEVAAETWRLPLTPSSARSKIDYIYTSTLPKGLCDLWKGENYLIFPFHLLHIYGMNRRGIFSPFTKYNLHTHSLTHCPAPNLPSIIPLCTKFPHLYHL
jgi:hypothetical protein